MTELDDSLLVHDEMAGPRIAKIIAPDLVLVVDDHGILDSFFGYGFLHFRNFLFVIDARRVDTDDHEAVLRVLLVQVQDMRHCLGAERTIVGPEIDQDDLAPELFKLKRRRIDPGIAAFEFGGFLSHKRIFRMLGAGAPGDACDQEECE